MGKSLGNAIYLSDTPEMVWERVRNAVTDPARVTIKIPGTPEICNGYKYHCVFNPEESDSIGEMCRTAQIGCVACKKRLNAVLNTLLDPIREKRAYYEEHTSEVRDLIVEGTRKANRIGNENLDKIKEKMHVLI
jgi:tryptophanyl-tRNA synthetase